MDLDARGTRAASSLRSQVEPALDVDAARQAVAQGIRRRRTAHSVVLSAGLVMVVVAVVGALAALSLVTGPGRDGDLAFDTGRTAADMAVLDGLPRSPIDGRESWRLPVVAKPMTDLTHGDTIKVYGRGFEPGELVGALMCAREAESEGVGGCMLGNDDYVFAYVTSSSAYEDGTVVIEFQVRRHITTPATGPVDCASEAERCLVAIGAADNYDRSGGTYVNFAGAPPFPEPSFTVEPDGPYAPGQTVATRASQLPPGRLYQVLQCAGETCATLARGHSAPDGTLAFDVVVNSVVYQDGKAVPCEEGCTLQLTGVGPPDATTSPFPAPVPLAFTGGEPVPEDQLPSPDGPVEDELPVVPVDPEDPDGAVPGDGPGGTDPVITLDPEVPGGDEPGVTTEPADGSTSVPETFPVPPGGAGTATTHPAGPGG